MEFEAKSARDGAWYDISTFLSHRSLETSDPEGKEQTLYFDAQRRRHDVRGCHCRFLVRYDHDQAEIAGISCGSASAGNPQIATVAGTPQKQPKPEDAAGIGATSASVPRTNISSSDYRLQELHAESASAGNAQIAGSIATPQKQPKPDCQRSLQAPKPHLLLFLLPMNLKHHHP
ncbi:unnamed protein product [Fraxinus pennsylvanica]|uniref:SAWADEE domain-containing protein n=1 Tax=Fraxinus pennsylvanica TaxID=56036 RepID=A0AAD2E3E8_9LAMI|nr:unnamed protein product [Fraxinus pennsylvanica]